MWLKWLPWRYVVRRLAKAHGILDPVAVLSHIHRFAEPSEVAAPIELLRAGVVFHARGLMNSGAIQHNLDWVWPYWVERQFDPQDEAFVPRAFSITHVNLTHRNWTAIGIPDIDALPIVDPRGLLTPFWDGWSVDAWILGEDEKRLLPSKLDTVEQRLDWTQGLAIQTRSHHQGMVLETRAGVHAQDGRLDCRQKTLATSDHDSWLVLSIRPYNPEGVSFIHHVDLDQDRLRWHVNGEGCVTFSQPPDRHRLSDYRRGDVLHDLPEAGTETSVSCTVGMCTAAAMYRIEKGSSRELEVEIHLPSPAKRSVFSKGRSNSTTKFGTGLGYRTTPSWSLPPDRTQLSQRSSRTAVGCFHGVGKHPQASIVNQTATGAATWEAALAGCAQLSLPDEHFCYLYEAALRALILHTPGEVYPGPYTYKRFWIRDTAFILQSLLCAGCAERAARALPHLLARQTRTGYFLSQEGEWDANGEALWILHQYCRMTGNQPPVDWKKPVQKAARWIVRKRLTQAGGAPHAGLLPAGFSAEHLGPNNHYYWDDYWGVAGLQSAAELLSQLGNARFAATSRQQADDLQGAIDRSLKRSAEYRRHSGIPAAPNRRMDAGAIGSLVAGYPLQILDPLDARLLATAEFLLQNCFVHGSFFQDMIHSGLNPYLTLHVAQILLRAGDARWFNLVEAVAGLASATGQWPEAIHPHTRGGCMGDGQHMWAASEWVMAMRNAFVREEGDRLILCSGIPEKWLRDQQTLSFGPTPTPWGKITVHVQRESNGPVVRWHGDWRAESPPIEVRLPRFTAVTAVPGESIANLVGTKPTRDQVL